MKGIFLVKNGTAAEAFEVRETSKPLPGDKQVQISVEAFGLNFADVMARKGMYKEAPPKPCMLGYDVAGIVTEVGVQVKNVKVGDRVTAMTRFGGYAEFAVTDATGVAIIPGNVDAATATTLSTQYCTAYYAAMMLVNLRPGDNVLIHSGAGGVGTALIQLAQHRKCQVFSTAGSQAKIEYLQKLGVQYPINYTNQDFAREVTRLTQGKGVDVIFDAVGGHSVKKGFGILSPGGRLICYGASEMTNRNILGKVSAALSFGIYHPLMFMMGSKGMLGVNMLQIADHKPMIIQECLEAVVRMTSEGVLKPHPATVFPVAEIAAAHDFLEKRKSIGKVAVRW